MPVIRRPVQRENLAPLQPANPVRQDVGSGLEQLGRGVMVAAHRVREEDEAEARRKEAEDRRQRERVQSALNDARELEYLQEEERLLTNAQSGVLHKGGQDALALSAPAYQALHQKVEDLVAGTPDLEAREVLKARLGRMLLDSKRRIEGHVAKATEDIDDTNFTALRAKTKAKLYEAAPDPAARALAIQEMVGPTRARAMRKGVPEAGDELVRQWRGEASEIVADSLIKKGLYGQARAWLADPEVKAAIGEKLGTYEGRLTQDERDEEGVRAAREMVVGFTNDQGRLSYDQALAALQHLEADPGVSQEVKKAARTEFTASSTLAESAWKRKVVDTADLAETKIANAGFRFDAARQEISWLRREDVGQGKLADDLRKWAADALEEKATGRHPTPGQRQAFVDFLLAWPANQTRYTASPSELKAEWRGKLAPRDLERAASMVATSGVQVRGADETLSPTVVAGITALGADAGRWGKKGPKTPEQKTEFAELHDAMLQAQRELRAKKGSKDIPAKELLDEAKKILTKGRIFTPTGEVEGGVTQLESRTSPAYSGSLFIPDDEYTKSKKALVNAGYPSTDEWIRWYYMGSVLKVPDAENPRPKLERVPRSPDDTSRAERRVAPAGSGAF